MILNVDSWIALPGRSVNPVTARTQAGFPKVEFTDLTQIGEEHAPRVSRHQVQDVFNPTHIGIVSILISSVKVDVRTKSLPERLEAEQQREAK